MCFDSKRKINIEAFFPIRVRGLALSCINLNRSSQLTGEKCLLVNGKCANGDKFGGGKRKEIGKWKRRAKIEGIWHGRNMEERVEREGEKSLKSRTSQGHFHLRYPVWNLSFLSRRHFNTYIYIYIYTLAKHLSLTQHIFREEKALVQRKKNFLTVKFSLVRKKFLKNLIIHSFITSFTYTWKYNIIDR